MTRPGEDHKLLRRYLLGELLEEGQRRRVEERLLTDDGFYEEVLIAEDELVEEYVSGLLDAGEKERFETHFLSTPERRHKLQFARAFDRYASRAGGGEPEVEATAARPGPNWRHTLFGTKLKVAAMLLLTLGLGLGSWRLFLQQSPVERGLASLRSAYRERRPVEERITGFDYAPLVELRGGEEEERVDTRARDRAELLLLDAVRERPGPDSRHALGRLYLSKRQFDKAIAQFEEALKDAPSNAQVHSDFGAALLERGKSKRLAGDAGGGQEDFGRSLEHLDKALELDGSLLEALFNRAILYQNMPLPKQAEDDWRRYLERDPDSPWADEARRRLKELGEGKSRASRSTEQLFSDFSAAYSAGDAEGSWGALSRSRARRGNAIVQRLIDEHLTLSAGGRREEARERLRMLAYAAEVEEQRAGDRFTADLARFYERATPAMRETTARARAILSTANERYYRSEYDAAIELYAKAGGLFSEAGDEGEALFSESWLGYCYLRIPDTGRSLAIFRRLAGVYEAKHYRSLFAQSLQAQADALSSLDQYSGALDSANRALQVFEQIGDAVGSLRCLQSFVSMHLTFGNYRESLGYGRRAIDLAAALPPDPGLVWPIYHESALDFYFLGLPATALDFQREALRLADETRMPLLKSRSYERLGLLYGQLKDHDAAMRNGELALEEGHKIEGELSRANVLAHATLNLAHLHQERGEFRKALEHYERAVQLYQKFEAFDAYLYPAHKGRLLALIGLGDDAAARQELETTLALYEEFRAKIVEENNRNRFFDVGQNVYDVAVDFTYTRLKDSNGALQLAESYRARSLLDMLNRGPQAYGEAGEAAATPSPAATPLPLAMLQKRLPAGVQVVEYAALDDKLIAWVVSGDLIKDKHVPVPLAELEAKVRSYLGLVSDPLGGRADEARKLASELHAVLIGPVEPLLKHQGRVFVVPDKVLNFVPFGALVSPDSGKYVIEDYELTLAPSANILVSCTEQARRRRADTNEKLLSVGNPRFDRGEYPALPDLTSAAREAEQVAALYDFRKLLTAEAATDERVKSEMGRASVIHLAAHAVLDARSPGRSRLLLAKAPGAGGGGTDSAGTLLAEEVYRMRLPHARLVVLSACQSGVEQAYRGEGAVGLARPFISVGVPLVVASYWPVDSEATADLMIGFHRHRRAGRLPTAEALRQAQLEMLRSPDPRQRHPGTWAAFVAIGGLTDF